MLYFYFILVIFLLSINKDARGKNIFIFFYFFFYILMMIRFGQGTDYFNYKSIYINMPHNFFIGIKRSRIEPAYYFINYFARKYSLGFPFVIAITTSITTFFLYKGIIKYSENKILSLFLLISNYFVYIQSGIRQGVALSIILFATLEYLRNNYKRKFYKYCVLAMTFHYSSFICVFFPLIIRTNLFKNQRISIGNFLYKCIFFLVFGIIFSQLLIIIAPYLNIMYFGYLVKYRVGLFFIFPLALRIILGIVAISLYNSYGRQSCLMQSMLRLYLFGIFVFVFFASLSQVVSRITEYYSIIEIILFANMIKANRYFHKTSVPSFSVFLIFFALFFKDIKAYEYEGGYYSKKIFDYPYITLFNKEKIFDYRADISKMSRGYILDDNPKDY